MKDKETGKYAVFFQAKDMKMNEALAERYLKINCSVMMPNKGRFDDLKHLVSDYRVDGVVEVVLQGCHTFAVEAWHTKNTIYEELGLPYLRVDTDFSQSDRGVFLKTESSVLIYPVNLEKN